MFDLVENLKFLMNKRNLTSYSLSKKAGLNKNAVDSIIIGRTSDPKLSTIRALAKALDCSVEQIVNESRLCMDEENYIDKTLWSFILGKKCMDLIINVLHQKNIDIKAGQVIYIYKHVYEYSVKKVLGNGKYEEQEEINNIEPDRIHAEWLIEHISTTS